MKQPCLTCKAKLIDDLETELDKVIPQWHKEDNNYKNYVEDYVINKNVSSDNVIEKPLFVMTMFHSCFAHGLMDYCFSYYSAMQDIISYESKDIEFKLFYRKNVFIKWPMNKQFISNKNGIHKINSFMGDFNLILTNSSPILEYFLNKEDSFKFKTCYFYVKSSNQSPYFNMDYSQRSLYNKWYPKRPYNYPGKKNSSDCQYTDEELKVYLNKFRKTVKLKYSICDYQKVNEKTSRLEVSMGEPTLCGVLIETEKNGLAKSIKPVRIGGVIDNVVI